uniref:Uncharacterized protein n=1 Tax=Strigamia maritima TaxID=126957 RepID=T1ITD2_STRMM
MVCYFAFPSTCGAILLCCSLGLSFFSSFQTLNTEMDLKVVVMLVVMLSAHVMADLMRKSIVFDLKTPKVFYCPQEKPTGFDKMIVKAKPLTKLCEFEGKGIPEVYKSDCYNDVDESEYACAEKRRIMKRLNPPSDEVTIQLTKKQ